MNPRLEKIEAEIVKLRDKISSYTVRLRELERQKTEIENAGIVALVRGVDVPPDKLMAFIQAYKEQSGGAGGEAMPEATTTTFAKEDDDIETDKE